MAVVGMARSGIGAAKLIQRLGGRALISEIKPASSLHAAMTELAGTDIEIETGAHERIENEEFDLVVLSPGVVPPCDLLATWERKGIPVWSELELASRVCEVPWIGVTGSNGKTTTVHLLNGILESAGHHVAMAGNVGNAWSNFLPAAPDQRFVVEVSSFQLEFAPTVKPNVAVLLNLFENHLDRHGSMEVYAELKSRLFRNQTTDDVAVVNGENEWVMKLAATFPGKVICFGTHSEFDFWSDGEFLRCQLDGRNQVILARKDFPLIGRHNELNALAATAAAYNFGVDLGHISQSLKNAKPVEHRIEFVAEKRGVRYVNDSKSTNMIATQTALNAFRSDVILLFGGRPKKESFSPLAARFSNPVKKMIVYGEAVSKVRGELPTNLPIQYTKTLQEAVALGYKIAREGDTVLLSPGCTSFDQFKDFEERGRMFKSYVSELA